MRIGTVGAGSWLVLGLACGSRAQTPVTSQAKAAMEAPKTRVVVLGTGTPQARPEASGPAVAIVAGGAAYLVDAGPYLLVLYRYAQAVGF